MKGSRIEMMMGINYRESSSRSGEIPQIQQHARSKIWTRSSKGPTICLRFTQWAGTASSHDRASSRFSGSLSMMKLALSPAAAGLLRALVARAGINRDRILLTDFRSVDWQSLTFIGERHEMELRIPPPDAQALADRISDGLGDAEFAIPGQIVADIGLRFPPSDNRDGSVTLHIEALTIAE